MLTPTNALLKPTENSVSSEKAVIIMNMAATNHGVQALFAKKLYPVIRLRIPRKARCGGKPVKNKNASRINPVTA